MTRTEDIVPKRCFWYVLITEGVVRADGWRYDCLNCKGTVDYGRKIRCVNARPYHDIFDRNERRPINN